MSNLTVLKYLSISKGHSSVHSICDEFGISYSTLLDDLSEEKRELIDKKKKDDAKQIMRANIARLISINSYRGMRLKSGLPSHGQRTRSNANSAKKLNAKRSRA